MTLDDESIRLHSRPLEPINAPPHHCHAVEEMGDMQYAGECYADIEEMGSGRYSSISSSLAKAATRVRLPIIIMSFSDSTARR